MKNKLFKIGKPMLSITVAVAILAVSLFAAVPGVSFNANAATVEDTWDGTLDNKLAGLGTDKDPYIISTAEQLAYVALGTKFADSKGKYYKVVDNAVFNLNGMEGITLDSDITVGDVMAATPTGKVWMPSESKHNNSFGGYFDGNGVVIYNMYSVGNWEVGTGDTGLFPNATVYPDDNGQLSFKNITLLNSRSNGQNFSGGIVGQAFVKGGSIKLAFENCRISNCWITDANLYTSGKRTSGILAGTVNHANTTIKNCIAIGNATTAANISGGLIGNTSQWNGGLSVSSCIVVGSPAYPALASGSAETLYPKTLASGSYSGVYTTEDVDTAVYADTQIKKVALEDMKGANAKTAMPNLDWTKWVAFDGELPDYRDNHTLVMGKGDELGHPITCSDCGNSMTESHTFVENEYGTMNECACGYSTAITDRVTDTWDGSFDSNLVGLGTKEDPFVIRTAEQMAYVALKIKPAESDGKYYKVAPHKVFNMNGRNGITLNSTAEQVKAASAGKNWENGENPARAFAGHFDGNGVIIYNVYSSGGLAALFPKPGTATKDSKGVSFKNITVVASYFDGYNQSAGIIASAESAAGQQPLTIENCAVKNCFINDRDTTNTNAQRTTSTIISSAGNFSATISNCLAVNNILDGTDISGGILGNAGAYGSQAKISNSVVIGSMPYPVLMPTASSGKSIHDFVINGGCFTNIYTDQTTSGYSSKQIKTLTADMMTGVNAPQNMDLDFGGYWFANEGLIDLLVCHDIEGSVNSKDNYAGHNAVCKVCGLNSVVIANHSYNSDYTCTICGFGCDHKNTEYITETEIKDADCVTPPHTRKDCACGYTERIDHAKSEGHKFEKTEAKAPTCAIAGNVEYYTCENCECIFLTDDIMATYDKAVSENEVVVPATGLHTVIKDKNNRTIYGMDDESHWEICEVCNAKLNRVEHTSAHSDLKQDSHNMLICEICCYELVDLEIDENGNVVLDKDGKPVHTGEFYVNVDENGNIIYDKDKIIKQEHTFNEDENKCTGCKWVCDHKDTVVAVAKLEPTCTLAGVKTAHYKCTVCDMRFEDEAATIQVAKAEVVLEKLGHEVVDVDKNGTPVHQYTDTHHWYNCKVCGKGDYAKHNILEDSKNYEGTYKWCEDETGYGCNYNSFDYSIIDKENAIYITAPTNAFTKDVITDIFTLNKNDLVYEDIKAIFDKTGQRYFAAYQILPSQEIAEGKKATITMEIINDLGTNASLFFVDLDGKKLVKIDTKVETILLDKNGNLVNADDSEEKKKVATPVNIATASTDKFGYFIIASADIVAGDSVDSNNNMGNQNNDNSMTSPNTSDSTVLSATVMLILASATVLFARKDINFN